MDVDATVADTDTDEYTQQFSEWVKCCVQAVSAHVPGDSAIAAALPQSPLQLNAMKTVRDMLPLGTAVLCTAPARMITKAGIHMMKQGAHIVWPSVLVSKKTARQLRGVVVTALYEEHPGKDWESIVDKGVYKHMSSLRMVHCYKSMKCPLCMTPESIEQRSQQRTLERQSATALKIPVAKCSLALLKTKYEQLCREQSPVPDALRSLFKTDGAAKDKCTRCGGKTKLADRSAGCYTASVVLAPDAVVMADLTDMLEKEVPLQIILTSLWRHDYPAVAVTLPANAPPLLKATEVDAGGKELLPPAEHDGDGPTIITVPQSKQYTESNYVRSPVLSSEATVMAAVQDWLRTCVAIQHWSSLQVSGIYRLLNQNKTAASKFTNGDPDYLIVVMVRGFGSSYCTLAGRSHTHNHIYFVINSSFKVVQKCHSESTAACKGTSAVFNIDPSTHMPLCELLYPHCHTVENSGRSARTGDIDTVHGVDENLVVPGTVMPVLRGIKARQELRKRNNTNVDISNPALWKWTKTGSMSFTKTAAAQNEDEEEELM
jgi:hypothetical protein